MSTVTWLCVLGVVLAAVAIAYGYVSIGVVGVVFYPLLAWYDWRAFGEPPNGLHWWNRFGPRPPTDGGGLSAVPAPLRPRPSQPSDAEAKPLPDEH